MNMANSLIIDNDLSSNQGNYFSVDVQSAGKTSTLRVTDPSATITAEDIVYAYQLYVVVDGTSQLLDGTAPVLISDDKVSSSGSFTGAAGNTIEWTVESLIKDGAMQMRNTISFTASTGTLGNIQVIQYLDQDVDGANDDVYFSRGSVAASNLELYALDNDKIIGIGVSQGGAFLTEQGLINASFDGWAACVYNESAKYINGTFTYTPSGEICSTLDNKNTTHPDIGAVKGTSDTITSFSWRVEPTANQSIVVSTLGGVPDAGVVLAVDDYIDLIENTNTENSKEFNVISNDIALDTPISFQTLTTPTNGAISLNGTIVTYTPNIGFFGQDSFTYEIVDNSADTDSATVHLNVQEDSDEDGTPNVDDADAVDPCIPSNLVAACDVNNNGIADGVEARALEVIKNYADDQSNALPTQADFSNLPVTGVTAANITEINSVIASLSSSDVDTVAEVQAIVNSVINSQAALNELKEDIAGNANNDLIDASELNAIRGVTNAIQANQAEYQAAFIATSPSPFADTANPTPAEIQAVIDSVNTIVANEKSALDELIAPIYTAYKNPQTATLFNKTAIDIQLTAQAETEEGSDKLNQELAEKIAEKLGIAVFSMDGEKMEEVVGKLLTERNETLSVAESCTGGLIGERLTDVSGSSAYFIEGAITYANVAKIRRLGVSSQLIENHGVVSAEVAEAMAEGMREGAQTTYALSVTGVAGPTGGTVEKPVGTVFIGYSSETETKSLQLKLPGDRNLIRWRSSQAALDYLRRKLLEKGDE